MTGKDSFGNDAIKIIADMAIRILRTEKYYITKFVDAFEKLSEQVQDAMLRYFVEEIGSDAWMKMYKDKMQHRDLLTYILFNFTGNELRGEPNKEELSNHLKHFVRSDAFRDAIYKTSVEEMIEEVCVGTI
jgi:hypothetical protein